MATPAPNSTAASALPAAGGTSEQTLSNYIGPYVTNMLGKAQAIANEPYQVYQGPMTAGTSNLQNKVFQGLGNLSFPGNLGKSFASPMGGGNTNYYGGPGGPAVMPQQGGFGPGVNNFGGPVSAGPGMPRPGQPARYDEGTGGGMRPAGGFNQGPKTEADWNRYSSTVFFGPGTDMAKEKADFLAGGQGGGPDKNNPLFAGVGAMPPGLDDSGYGGPVSAGPGAMPPMGDYPTGGGMPLPPGYNTGTAPTGIAGLTPPQTSQQPSSIAQSYMNPYLESVLAPQMEEMRRQSKLNLQPGLAKLTQAGGFGGGRQAIMESEAARNLLSEQNKTVGQGYASAFDKAMGQFNTEQGQSKDLVNMLANAGQAERGIEQEGITADYNEFLAQRDDPMKKTQYLQSMLQGLPITTVTNTQLPKSGIGQLVEAFGGMTQLEDALKKFKLG